MTITKDSLVEMIHSEVGLNKREAKELIESFFEEIKSSLEKGNDIKLSGFGNFILRDKSSRPGRNPKTGEEVTISDEASATSEEVMSNMIGLESLENLEVSGMQIGTGDELNATGFEDVNIAALDADQ